MIRAHQVSSQPLPPWPRMSFPCGQRHEADDQELRQHLRVRRDHQRRDEQVEDHLAAAEPDPRQCVPGHGGDQDVQHGVADRDDEAVAGVGGERGRLERVDVVAELPAAGQESGVLGGDLHRRLEGGDHHPDERHHHQQGDHRQRDVERDPARGHRPCGRRAPAASRCSGIPASAYQLWPRVPPMIRRLTRVKPISSTNSTRDWAQAYPTRNSRKADL